MPTPAVSIYTDGSCYPNPGRGGWAAVLVYPNNTIKLSGSARLATNNQMELAGAIKGLMFLKERHVVNLTTDSKYVCDAFRMGWLSKWEQNGWRSSSGAPVKNQQLWKVLLTLSKKHSITWLWVKGHTGHPYNELADQLAGSARKAL